MKTWIRKYIQDNLAQPAPLIDDRFPRRMTSKVVILGDCWLWRGNRTPLGYGQVRWNGKLCMAHRVFWEIVNGKMPAGLESDHTCNRRNCVNPNHIQAVTHRENQCLAAVRRANL